MRKFINSVFEAGIYPDLDEWEKRRIRLLNRLVLIAVVGTLVFSVSDIINGYYEVALIGVIVTVLAAIEQVLVKRRNYNSAKLMITSFILLISIFFPLAVGNKTGAQYMILPLIMMPLLIFKSLRTSVIMFVIMVSGFIVTINLQKVIAPVILLSDNLVFPYTIMAAILMMSIIFLLTLYSNSLNSDFEKIIIHKNEQLEGAYKDIKDSINYAKRLQEAILPSEHFIKEHLPNSFVLYKPKDIVAGDFYWFHTVGSESRINIQDPNATEEQVKNSQLLIAAADCTGHGVPGALVSVVCSNALNRAVIEFGITEPGKILDKVRELVIETFEKSGNGVKDGMDISFASITAAPGSDHLTIKWAGANNPLWYVSGGAFHEIKPDKQPIGKHEISKPFTTHTLDLKKGDTLFLFTDGYADQFGGPKGKKFKYKQLAQLVFKNASIPVHEQKKILNKTFESWRGQHEQIDDVCMIGITL